MPIPPWRAARRAILHRNRRRVSPIAGGMVHTQRLESRTCSGYTTTLYREPHYIIV